MVRRGMQLNNIEKPFRKQCEFTEINKTEFSVLKTEHLL